MKRFALLIFALSAVPLMAQIQVGSGGAVNVVRAELAKARKTGQ